MQQEPRGPRRDEIFATIVFQNEEIHTSGVHSGNTQDDLHRCHAQFLI